MAIAKVTPVILGAGPAPNYVALQAAGIIVPEFIERGLDADFSFDLPTDGSYRSRISPFEFDRAGKSATLQDNVAGKYLTLDAGQNGLIGPTSDAREMTYAALYNYRNPSPSTSWQVIAGNMTETAGDGGEAVAVNSTGSVNLSVRGYASTARINLNEFLNQGLPADNLNAFIFIAVTSRLTGGANEETEHTLFAGLPSPVVSVRTGVKVLSSRRIAMGNAYRTNAAYNAMPGRFGRFFSGSGHRSIAELTGIYQRAKIVAARRGVQVI